MAYPMNENDIEKLFTKQGYQEERLNRLYPMNENDIEKLFTYRRWTPEEVETYRPLREMGKELALKILSVVPECPQRTRAINAVHEAVYLINTAATLYPSEENKNER